MSYLLGKDKLDPENLPARYAMLYPANVQVVMSTDRILRITLFAPGYLFRDKIEVGTSVEDVFKVLGPPAKTVENAQIADVGRQPSEDGVFYKDMNGVVGTCLYQTPSQGVILYFTENRVRQMMVQSKSR